MDDVTKHVFKLQCTTCADSARLPSWHTTSGSVFYAFAPQGNAVQQLNSGGNVIGTVMYDSAGIQSSQNLPHYACPIYICYDWARDMFECASYGSGMDGSEIAEHYACSAGHFISLTW
jgi:hypothetical protein